VTPVDQHWIRLQQCDGAFLFARPQGVNDPRVHFGLGQKSSIDELEIRWPSGRLDRTRGVPLDRILVVEENKGITKVMEPRKQPAK